MLVIFNLDNDIITVYWLYENQSIRTSDKKVINKVYTLFVHPSYVYADLYSLHMFMTSHNVFLQECLS